MQLHFNRLVIHPDYCGFGLGLRFLNACAALVQAKGYAVRGKFSSTPVHQALSRSPLWKLVGIERPTRISHGSGMERPLQGFRRDVKLFAYAYIGSAA